MYTLYTVVFYDYGELCMPLSFHYNPMLRKVMSEKERNKFAVVLIFTS